MIEGFNGFCIKAFIGRDAVDIGLLTTTIRMPKALPLECTAIVCGVFGGIGKFVSRKLQIKDKKHKKFTF